MRGKSVLAPFRLLSNIIHKNCPITVSVTWCPILEFKIHEDKGQICRPHCCIPLVAHNRHLIFLNESAMATKLFWVFRILKKFMSHSFTRTHGHTHTNLRNDWGNLFFSWYYCSWVANPALIRVLSWFLLSRAEISRAGFFPGATSGSWAWQVRTNTVGSFHMLPMSWRWGDRSCLTHRDVVEMNWPMRVLA